jgi:DnaA-like protein
MIDYVREADGSLRKVNVGKLQLEPPSEAYPRANYHFDHPTERARFHDVPPSSWVTRLPPCVRATGERIAREHGLTFAQIASRRRYAQIVAAKHRWWIVTKWTLGLSYPETARLFGGLDHTSVMHAQKNVSAMLEREHQP